MTSIAKAKRIYQETGSFSVSSAKTGVNRNTLKTWARRYKWRKQGGHKVKPEVKPKGQWMQSLHHEHAHFIVDGKAACADSRVGARLPAGSSWQPWNECLRKCQKCMHHDA